MEENVRFLNKLKPISERKINKDKLPKHIAIIPDGNGRWASSKGIPRNAGHREGSNTIKEIVEYCAEIGIEYLTIYAFSTENWNRPRSEVDYLMSLIQEFLHIRCNIEYHFGTVSQYCHLYRFALIITHKIIYIFFI
jgi:undecaprenyl diphosphate synthase